MSSLTRTWLSISANNSCRLLWQTTQQRPNALFMYQAKQHCHHLQRNVINIPPKQQIFAYYIQSRTLSITSTVLLNTSAFLLSPPVIALTLSSSFRIATKSSPKSASTLTSTPMQFLLCNRKLSKNNTNISTFDSCYHHKYNQNCYCNYVFSTRHSHLQTVQQLLDICQRVLEQTQKRSYSTEISKRTSTTEAMDVPEGLFRGCVDRFNGVIVESGQEYDAATDFPKKLQESLDYWKSIKRRAIWFTVQKEHAAWVPHLANAGFEFHHVCTTPSAIVMYRWLPTDEYANIPTFCHTMLGVGGLVVNDKNEVLVVSDRFALIPNSWKLPGGYVEPGEEIVAAAIREVKEETGIDAEFRTVISIRHAHGGSFGCSDMYVVVALKPLNLKICKCEREIARAQWMPIDEYLQHPDVHETNRLFVRTYLDYQKRNIRFTCQRAKHRVLKREYSLYYMKPIEGGDDDSDCVFSPQK